jgi:hypothetical protein
MRPLSPSCLPARTGYAQHMGNKGDSSKDDPLNLHPVDHELHIEQLKAQLKNIAGEDVIFGEIPGGDPAVREAFLEHVLAFESQESVQPFDALINDGLDLPPSEELSDAALTVKLWELIRARADRHFFLSNTDHLGDRELYAWLRNDALREECQAFGGPIGDWHLGVLGSCSEEDLTLWMRFYASDEERRWWAAQYPSFRMPPEEKPPFDRDQLLPKPEAP